MKTNALPNHGCSCTVSVVIEEQTVESVKRADDVKTLMSVVLKKLEQFGFLVSIHEDCVMRESDPDSCNDLRGCVQELINQALLQFSRSKAVEEIAVIEYITVVYRRKKVEPLPEKIQPIHIRVPSLFPYQNTKVVPWKYEMTTYIGGKEI